LKLRHLPHQRPHPISASGFTNDQLVSPIEQWRQGVLGMDLFDDAQSQHVVTGVEGKEYRSINHRESEVFYEQRAME
jgi:hypothetical protein